MTEPTVPLSDERLTEIRSTLIGDWLAGAWRIGYVEGDGEEAAFYRVLTPDGITVATLPDWAHPIAVFIADAHEAVPELLAEVDRLRALVRPYEAAIAAVAVQAAEWAALAPADDWGNGPHDAVLSDVGRRLQRLMAQPAAAVSPEDGGR